jgi:uncharacterized membrane protein YkoI
MRNAMLKLMVPVLAGLGMLAAVGARADEHAPAMISIIEAIEIAQTNMKANLLGAELDTKDDTLCYKVDVSKAGNHFQLWINAHTGTIVRARKPFFSNLWIDVAAGEKLKIANNVPSPTNWLRAVESETGGTIDYVRFAIEDDQPEYEVGLATGAGAAEIVIDALTGNRKPE